MFDDLLTKRLSQFTPDGSGLDRDALLFAAGRASARPNRRWLALAGALAVSQVFILGVFLWPRPAAPVLDPIKADPPIVAIEPPLPPIPAEPSEAPGLWALRERLIAADGKLEFPSSTDLAVSKPPFHVLGPLPAELAD